MKTRKLIPSAILAAMAIVGAPDVAASPLLGETASVFAVFGGGGVTSSGATTIEGSVGSAPTNSISGFPPAIVSGGAVENAIVSGQARNDAAIAFNFLTLQSPTQILTGTDLGGLTLGPGTYDFASLAQLTGTLTTLE
jgi:hypothetical protein